MPVMSLTLLGRVVSLPGSLFVLIGLGCVLATLAWKYTYTDNGIVHITNEISALEIEVEEAKEPSFSEQKPPKFVSNSSPNRTASSTSQPDQETLLTVHSLVHASTSSPEQQFLTVVSFNILVGGADGRLEQIAEWLASLKPDVVGLMECNSFTSESLDVLAKRWGHSYSVLAQAGSGFHVALTSRLPMENVEIDNKNFKHALIKAHIAGIDVLATHLRPESGDLRLNEVVHLKKYLDNGSVLLIGDLNSLSSLDSPFYTQSHLEHIADAEPHDNKDAKLKMKFAFEGQLDYRVIDVLLKEGLIDLGHVEKTDTGFLSSTVPTKINTDIDFMNNDHAMRLDYCFAKNLDGKCEVVKSEQTALLSDHYPLLCQIQMLKKQ